MTQVLAHAYCLHRFAQSTYKLPVHLVLVDHHVYTGIRVFYSWGNVSVRVQPNKRYLERKRLFI